MSAKSFIKNVVGILVLVFLFDIPVLGLELNLKLSGGYAYLDLKNINLGVESWSEWIEREAGENKNWLYLGKNVQSLHSGIHLEGEILLSFSSRLGISLGTGYIYGDLKEKETEVLVQRPTGILSQVFPVTVNAYPIVLSGYYFIPLSSKFHIYARGGGGLAWAKYVYREAKKLESAAKYNYFRLGRASASGPILLGGLGFVYETEIGVRFFVEGLMRTAKIQGFSGENELEDKGTLYYFEEYSPDLDFWLTKNEIRTEKPSGPYFRSVSEAVVDFSGFSVKIGFIIRF
ncbi:MAG: hypothetical protein JSV17_03155 [Candidatus Aminicenantes bacterium]|nr:MAG: hypothetical protein JSV17_03155 [Candidatus Aminicenantes bacterium]